MLKNILYLILLIPITMLGQTKDHFSNSGILLQGKTNLHASIGQIFVNQSSSSNMSLSEGFHQTFIKKEVTKSNNKTSIYPNPATNWLNISAQTDIKNITLFNISGQIIDTQSGSLGKSIKIDFSTIPQGIFFIEVIENNQVKTIQKIIKI